MKQRIDPVEVWKKALSVAKPNLDVKRTVDRLEVLKDGSVFVHNNADWKKK